MDGVTAEPVALSSTRTLLALVLAPSRLQLYAAGSRRCIVDEDVKEAGAAARIRLSECSRWLAWAGATGTLRVFGLVRVLDGEESGRATIVPRLSVRLDAPVGGLAWHCTALGHGPPQLASGDARGEVRLWPTADAAHGRVLLAAEGSPIVQLECDSARGLLLASTHARSTLVALGDLAAGARGAQQQPDDGAGAVRPIGKAKRDGPHGACFLDATLAPSPSAAIVASRPGRRLWLVGADGAVLSTLRLTPPPLAPAPPSGSVPLADVTDSTPSSLLPAGDGGGGGGGGELSFGRLLAVPGLGLVISYGGSATDGHVCVVDADAVTVLDVARLAAPVLDVACLGFSPCSADQTMEHARAAAPQHALHHVTEHARAAAPDQAPESASERAAARIELLVLHAAPPRLLRLILTARAAAALSDGAGSPSSGETLHAPPVAAAIGTTAPDTAQVPGGALVPGGVDQQWRSPLPDGADGDVAACAPAPNTADGFAAAAVAVDAMRTTPKKAGVRAGDGPVARRQPSVVRRITNMALIGAPPTTTHTHTLTASTEADMGRPPIAAASSVAPSAVAGETPNSMAMGVSAAAAAAQGSSGSVWALAPGMLPGPGHSNGRARAETGSAVGAVADSAVLSWREGLEIALQETVRDPTAGQAGSGWQCDESHPLVTAARAQAPRAGADALAAPKAPAKPAKPATRSRAATARPVGHPHTERSPSLQSTLPPLLTSWLHSGRAARALVVLVLHGWRTRWRNGALAHALERHGSRVRLEQWPALLVLARHADGGSTLAFAAASATTIAAADDATGTGAVGAAAVSGSAAVRARAATDCFARPPWGGASATLLLLRGMLGSQSPTVCLGVLRRQPVLADRLPPRGYVELMHAVQRENRARGGAASVS